jgi:hypothetical protein
MEHDRPRRITHWRVVEAPDRRGEPDVTPFPWHERAAIATDRPPKLVRVALWDEIRQGRVESDGNGRVRLRAGALPEDVIAALALFVD